MTNSIDGRDRGRRSASVLVWMLAGLSAAAAGASGAEMRANPLPRSDLGRPFALDQQGRRIAMIGGWRDAPAHLPAGVAPTYLAYRLGPRSHPPDGTPIVSTVPGRGGPATGMLQLDALAKASLDAELAKTGRVALMTPRQTFLVESWGNSVLAGAPGNSKTWRADVETPADGAEPKGGGDKREGTIEGWYNTSANAFKNWNQQALDAVKKMFKVDPPKPVIIPPKNVAAQTLGPPSEAAQITPAPVPEPASLIVFAAGATFAAWRFGTKRRRTRRADPS